MLNIKIKLNTINDVKEFLNITNKIEEDIDLNKGRYIIDAKSAMGLFTIDISDPVKIVIHSDDTSLLEQFKQWEVN